MHSCDQRSARYPDIFVFWRLTQSQAGVYYGPFHILKRAIIQAIIQVKEVPVTGGNLKIWKQSERSITMYYFAD